MKKSLKNKFLVLTFTCVLITAILIGGISILTAGTIVDKNSKSVIQLSTSTNANAINTILTEIEQSVNITYSYAVNRLQTVDDYLAEPETLDYYIESVTTVLESTAQNTPGAISAYFCLNPELGLANSGILLVNDKSGSIGFTHQDLPDIANYSEKKLAELVWYSIPKKQRKAVWTDPYINKNINNTNMISYVIPIYRERQFIGVIGMDIDMELIINRIDSINIYETGFAFLCNADGDIIYHKDYPAGVTQDKYTTMLCIAPEELEAADINELITITNTQSKQKKLSAQRLENDMVLVLSIPAEEINIERNQLMSQILIALFIVLGIAFIATIETSAILFKPIKHLTEVSKKIASGDLDVEIQCKSKDEIGVLTESFRTTVTMLKGYISTINKQAFTDAATGVGNKAAYADAIKRIEIIKRHDTTQYAVAVFDINYLKMYNDKYGHEFGDMLIADAADIIRQVFGNYEVFRIGGDEFVAILINYEAGILNSLKEQFKNEIVRFNNKSTRYELGLHVAIGTAEFDRSKPNDTYTDVFNRADKEMYEHKLEIKAKNKKLPDDYVDDRL